MKRAVLIFFTLLAMNIFVYGQRIPVKLQEKIAYMELDFLQPVEQAFEYKKAGKNKYFTYDLRLIDKDAEQDVFIFLHPETEKDIVQYPHIEFTRLLANLATNDQEKDIMVVTYDNRKLALRNADWGSESYFTIKSSLSNYPHAKLLSFYKEGKGMVSILYCFDKPDRLPFLFSFLPKSN